MIDYIDTITTERRMGRPSKLVEAFISLMWFGGIVLAGLFIASTIALLFFTEEQIGTAVFTVVDGI